MDFLNERVAPYEEIRELELRKELPMTLVVKVLRRVLQEEEKQKMQKPKFSIARREGAM